MSRNTTLLAGGALVLTGMVGYTLFRGKQGGGSNSGDLGEIDVDEEDVVRDCITSKEVADIFDQLFMQLQEVLSKIMQQLQAIQMQGQQIPEAQVKNILKMEMERALVDKQQKLLDEYNMDYDCLEEATWEFLAQEDEYPAVQKAVNRFQKLWESTTGEAVAGFRPGQKATNAIDPSDLLEPDKLIEVAEVYFNALTASMRTIVQQYKADGKNLQDPSTQQQLNRDFGNQANEAGENALEEQGVSMKVFEASVKEHSSNESVGRALGMLQLRQQQELMGIGQG